MTPVQEALERTFDIERTMHDDALDQWRERYERDCNAVVMPPSVDVYVDVMSTMGD